MENFRSSVLQAQQAKLDMLPPTWVVQPYQPYQPPDWRTAFEANTPPLLTDLRLKKADQPEDSSQTGK